MLKASHRRSSGLRTVSIVHIFNNALRITEILIHQAPDAILFV